MGATRNTVKIVAAWAVVWLSLTVSVALGQSGLVKEFAGLLASDATEMDQLGVATSIDDGFAFVGTVRDDEMGALSGAVYVFAAGSGGWSQHQKLVPPDGDKADNFGWRVCSSEQTALVGAPLHANPAGVRTGAVYDYRLVGDQWVEVAQLFASDGILGDRFGWSVAIGGEVAAVGAREAGVGGAAYVFRFDGSQWVEEQKLVPSDVEAGDQFGSSISISGDRLVVGSRWEDDACPSDPDCDSGAAYVYRFDGGVWVEEAKLVADDAIWAAELGISVAIRDDLIVTGAWGRADSCSFSYDCRSGAAYVFERVGSSWTQAAKLVPESTDDNYRVGYSVSLEGPRTIALGALGAETRRVNTGGVFIYRKYGRQWRESALLAPSTATTSAGIGWSVATSKGLVLVGAPGDDTAAPDAGAGYLFRIDVDFVRGDCNGDGLLDIADAVLLLEGLFSVPLPIDQCRSACDANDDAAVDITDAVRILTLIFGSASAPALPAPSGECGPDWTPDSLTCERYDSCP